MLELEEKAKKINWNKQTRNTWYVLFSINGYTPELEQLAKERTDVKLTC